MKKKTLNHVTQHFLFIFVTSKSNSYVIVLIVKIYYHSHDFNHWAEKRNKTNYTLIKLELVYSLTCELPWTIWIGKGNWKNWTDWIVKGKLTLNTLCMRCHGQIHFLTSVYFDAWLRTGRSTSVWSLLYLMPISYSFRDILLKIL